MANNSKNEHQILESGTIDFKRYIRLFKRKKLLLLFLFSTIFILFLFVALNFGPSAEYEASALLQFEDNRALSGLEARGRAENEGKFGLILSRNFLGNVVEKLSMEVKIQDFDRYTVIDTVAVDDQYAEGSFKVERNGDNFKLFYTNKDLGIENKLVLEKNYPQDGLIEYNGVKLWVLPDFWLSHNEFEYGVSSKHKAVESLRASLNPKPANRDKTLMLIDIRGVDRLYITKTMNVLIDLFVQQNLDFKKFHTREVLKILSAQLQTAKVELDEAVEALKKYREKNPWVGLTNDANTVVMEIAGNESQKQGFSSRIQELELIVNRVQSNDGEARYLILNELLSFLGAQAVSTVPALTSEMNTLMADRSRLLSTHSTEHPSVLENAQKLGKLEEKILLTAANQRAQYENQVVSLKGRISQSNYRIQNLPARELDLAELQRRRSVADEVYSSLLIRQNQAKVSDAVEVGDIIIIDPAALPQKDSLTGIILKYGLIGLLLAFGGSFGLVILRDVFDKTVRNAEELEKKVKLPVIARIPVIGKPKQGVEEVFREGAHIDPKLVTADYSPTPVGEAYRGLRTRLLFQNEDRPVKSIFITSLNPNEGKSLNTGNLAITFAQQKLPTLLVDADLRRGVLHNSFACKKKPGLADFIYSNADINDENLRHIIQQTHIPNLYMISTGIPVPNPSEIIGGLRAREIFEFLKKRFGMIIIDSPPINVTTDSVIISRYVDRGLFVVGSGKTNIDEVNRKISEYPDFREKLEGVILNFAEEEFSKDRYKYSYYNY